jgi:hypothetical protein
MSRLARALLPTARRALCLPPAQGAQDAALLAAAYDALDGFLAEPVASRYLRAVRSLDELSRLRRSAGEIDRLARRSLDAELDRLERLSVAATPVDALRSLPADARAGRRIQALAALLEAHRSIAQRVRAPERLRAKLEVVSDVRPRRQTERRR